MPIPIPALLGAGAALLAAAGWVYRHAGRPRPPRHHERVEQPSAKDWRPLMDAIDTHVRDPLRACPTVGSRWKSAAGGEYPLEYANGGEILAGSDRLTVLSYTLVYACMHFDALRGLLARQECRDSLLTALSRTAGGNGDGPAVLHVDIGCGPGTASWAVMNVLPRDARVTTIGHDHNPHMVELARAMTAAVAHHSAGGSCSWRFRHDRRTFKQDVETALAEQRWNTVLVTVNSVFGKMALIDLLRFKQWIPYLCERRGPATAIVAGTHPQFEARRVRDAFQPITDRVPGAVKLFDGCLRVCSGSPRRYEPPSWVPWEPKPQLGHVVGVGIDAG